VATIDLNIKNIVILMGLLGTLIGNVFFVGKLYNEFEILRTDVMLVKNKEDVLPLKNDILELEYRIKTLHLMHEGFGEEQR
jgi:hypothetical protein